jgi:NACHT domain- and WD repeat-containing protein
LQQADEAGVADTVAMEVEAQKKFGEGRARHFTGRKAELDTIARYLSGSDPHAFAVHGEGGCGKSAFVARAFELAKGDNPETAIFRSIGATPSSSDVRSLLEGLCRQISDMYGADKSTVPSTYEDLVKDFKERLDLAAGGGTLVIFLDALDQLSDNYNARSMVWLPNELPQNVRLVVSTRSGEEEAEEKELVTLKRKLPEQNILQLGPMRRAEGDSLLTKWLADVGRTVQDTQREDVQDTQREEILSKFEASKGNPLYLRMAFQEARRWTSAMTGKDIALGTSVVGIIKNLYGRLSDNRNHGEVLTWRALGYLAASRHGLSEDEFIDILSKDADPVVLQDFLRRSPDSPQDIERLPVAVWSRLFLDLEPYLTERISESATLLYFYHRELGDAAEEIYLNDSTREERHRVLAEYFNRKGDPQGDGYRANKADERKRWEGSSRALSELPYHVTHADMLDELFSTLTDFEFLENKAARVSVSEFAGSNDQTEKLYGGVFELQKDYELALETFPTE